MSATIETRRVKEAFELQFTAIRTYASRLASEDMDELASDLNELEHAVSELRGMVESLPHRGAEQQKTAGAPPASPATSRPERVAKGSETATGTQRPGARPE